MNKNWWQGADTAAASKGRVTIAAPMPGVNQQQSVPHVVPRGNAVSIAIGDPADNDLANAQSKTGMQHFELDGILRR